MFPSQMVTSADHPLLLELQLRYQPLDGIADTEGRNGVLVREAIAAERKSKRPRPNPIVVLSNFLRELRTEPTGRATRTPDWWASQYNWWDSEY